MSKKVEELKNEVMADVEKSCVEDIKAHMIDKIEENPNTKSANKIVRTNLVVRGTTK